MTSTPLYGYICFHAGKRIEVHAAGSYAAQQQAGQTWKLKPNKFHAITVCLAERPDGSPVQHVAVD